MIGNNSHDRRLHSPSAQSSQSAALHWMGSEEVWPLLGQHPSVVSETKFTNLMSRMSKFKQLSSASCQLNCWDLLVRACQHFHHFPLHLAFSLTVDSGHRSVSVENNMVRIIWNNNPLSSFITKPDIINS